MEKPRYIYEDGYVIDRERRRGGWHVSGQCVIGSLIVDSETEKTIATSFVSFISTCGVPGCRCCGEYDQRTFDSWHDADAWLVELNEKETQP